MGKGDKKTYKGKLFKGSYGVKRPRRDKKRKKKIKLLASSQMGSTNSGASKPVEKAIPTKTSPQKNKNDEKREKIFEVFKDHLNFLNDKEFVSTERDVYLCPLDLKPHHNVYEEDPLSLEDAPPKSLGGKAHVLTCTSCNNDRGQDIDASLANIIKEAKIVNQALKVIKSGSSLKKTKLPKSDQEVYVDINGNREIGKLKIDKDGNISIGVERKLPENALVNLIGSKIPKEAQYSLLKAAYMMLFKKYGYSLILDKSYDIVREQIKNPDKNIYPDDFSFIFQPDDISVIENNEKKEVYSGAYFIMDKGLESMLVIFDIKEGEWKRKIGVILPLPINKPEDVIAKIRSKMSNDRNLLLYPKEQDRENAGKYLMDEENLKVMYKWIETRKEESKS